MEIEISAHVLLHVFLACGHGRLANLEAHLSRGIIDEAPKIGRERAAGALRRRRLVWVMVIIAGLLRLRRWRWW